MAMPCPASASANKVCGFRLWIYVIVGLSPAIRLAASKARRNPNPPSMSSNGNPARSATSMVRRGPSGIDGWRTARNCTDPSGRLPKCCSLRCDRVQQVLAEMDFPAFEHRQYFTARTLSDFYLDTGISLRVPVQKMR